MATRKIVNTTAEIQETPMLGLLLGQSGGIEAQEKAGQGQLVHSESLPTEGSENPAWAKMGVTFGDPNPRDPMFRPATLPAGWKKVGTDHSMWSKLVDDKGRERATIFYKAAFYDRRAHMGLSRRFRIQRIYDKHDRALVQFEVLDSGNRVFATEPEKAIVKDDRDYYSKVETIEMPHRERATAWLTERFPQWQDVTAHWD